MNVIPKLKINQIKSNDDWKVLNYLSQMKIKKVRKNLLSADFNKIKEFNEELKLKYPNKNWIKNLHTKENWINEILTLIKRQANSLLYIVENISGYVGRERHRLDSNYLVISDVFYTTSYYPMDYNTDSSFSNKINCVCKKELLSNYGHILFEPNSKYQYRVKDNGEIYVYTDEFSSYIFEGDSFYEYFNSPLSRDRNLNSILSN